MAVLAVGNVAQGAGYHGGGVRVVVWWRWRERILKQAATKARLFRTDASRRPSRTFYYEGSRRAIS